MILENLQVAKPRVLAQVQKTRSICLQNRSRFHDIQLCQAALVIWRLDNHFMSADTMHGSIQPVGLLIQLPFNAQDRELVGNDPDLPARTIRRAAHGPLGKDFRWRSALLAGTEGADRYRCFLPTEYKFARMANALIFNDDPGPLERVPSEFRQSQAPSGCCPWTVSMPGCRQELAFSRNAS